MFSLRWVQVLIGLMVIGALLISANFGYLNFIKDWVLRLASLPVKIVTQATVKMKDSWTALTTVRVRLKEHRILWEETRRLRAENARLQQEREENGRLRQLVGLKSNMSATTVAASVVSRDPTGISGLVTIDKGRGEGLSSGDAVLDEYGSLLGVISEVAEYTSKFLLITDGLVKIDARVQGSNILGLVVGSHSVGVMLDVVPQNVTLKKDSSVVTSGLTGAMPAGILIGFIDESQSSASGLFQKFSLKPAADLKNFRFVAVVIEF